MLITRLRKTALVGLRLRRLKFKCPPKINLVSPQREVSKCTFKQFFRTVATLAEEKKKMLRLRGWNSCRIRVPNFEFPAKVPPVLPETSPGSLSVHLETCTGSVIHTLSVYHSLLAIRRAGAVHYAVSLLQTGRPRNRVSIPSSKKYQVSYSVGNWCSFATFLQLLLFNAT